MKLLTDTILNAQIETSVKPAVQVDICDYDFPARPSNICFGQYNWRSLLQSSEGEIAPCSCVTKNGTLILIDAGGTVYRYPEAGVDTDYSAWLPDPDTITPSSYYPSNSCVIASPISDEIMHFWITAVRHVYCNRSTDDGITWIDETDLGEWKGMPNDTYTILGWVRAAYKPNSDDIVVLATGYPYGRENYGISIYSRTSGAWSQSPVCRIFPWHTSTENMWNVGTAFWDARTAAGSDGNLESSDIMWVGDDTTGDWFIPLFWVKGDPAYSLTLKLGYAVYGGGNELKVGQWFHPIEKGIDVTDVYEVVNSWNDLSSFGATEEGRPYHILEPTNLEYLGEKWSEPKYIDYGRVDKGITFPGYTEAPQWQGWEFQQSYHGYDLNNKQVLQTNKLYQMLTKGGKYHETSSRIYTVGDQKFDMFTKVDLRVMGVGHAAYISGFGSIFSIGDGNKIYFMKIRPDLGAKAGVVYKSYSIEHPYPLQMAWNDAYEYIYAVGGGYLFRSPKPREWTIPTIGTGEGDSYTIPTSNRILKIVATQGADNIGQCLIVLNNHDGYFDSPGTGDIANIAKGALVKLYKGVTIGDTDYVQENGRYFINAWSYTREPNRSIFRLHCIDAWGLLKSYQFDRDGEINELENEYTVYDVIEMMIKCIGGSLSYITRSSDITSIYPRITIKAGNTPDTVIRSLLSLVPDVIRFEGNSGTIINPLTSDPADYYYSFPSA